MIDVNVRKEIINNTRNLGTNIDSYLKDFLKVSIENSGKINSFEDWRDNSEQYKIKANNTLNQAREVFHMLGIFNDLGKRIIPDFKDEIEFENKLNEQIIEYTLKNKFDINLTRNINKLFNSFIYMNGINYLESAKEPIDNFIDDNLLKRIKDMKSKFISNNLHAKMYEKMKEFLSSIGFEESNEVEGENLINIDDQTLEKQSEKYKEDINTTTKDIIQFIAPIMMEQRIKIPFYQREYVWDEEISLALLKDIFSNEKDFINLGNILIKQEPNEFTIVDGQQRMTTMILIIDIFVKIINERKLEDKIKTRSLIGFLSYFEPTKFIENIENISNEKYKEDLEKVISIPVDKTFLEKEIKNSNIISNYFTIHNFLNEKTDEDIINGFKKLKFVFISETTDYITDEIELFIKINSSRVPLSNFDLIKSLLISKIELNWESKKIEEINKLILSITNLLKFNDKDDNKAKDQFFTLYMDYISLRELLKEDEKNIFARYKKLIGDNIHSFESLKNELERIQEYLNYHYIIKGINDDDLKLKDILKNLSGKLKVNSIYEIYILYVVETLIRIKKDSKIKESNYEIYLNSFRRILLSFEMFDLKWKLFKFSGDSLRLAVESIFKRTYEEIDMCIKEEKPDDIFRTFIEIIKDGDGFMDKLMLSDEKNSYDDFMKSENLNKDVNATSLIYRVNFYLFNRREIDIKSNDKFYEILNPTLEHIFPQKSINWFEEDRVNTTELTPLLQNIGNKLILNGSLNSSISNNVFGIKMKEGYKTRNEVFVFDKTILFEDEEGKFDFLSLEKWTTNSIIRRNKFIIKTLLEYWEKLINF